MRIIINGVNGRLGAAIAALARSCGIEIAAGADINAVTCTGFPVYPGLGQISEPADVIIDCSVHSAVRELLEYAEKRALPVVIATTGHTDEEKALVREYSKKLPIFMSANMSLGVNTLIEAAKMAARVLGSFDIEIVEAHHSKKTDAPSGTALMLANAVNSALPGPLPLVCDRSGERQARGREIGMHSIRGGTIAGEHEVMFIGQNEILKISHSALSRDVFAEGVLAAASFIADKPAGFYGIENLIRGIQ